MMTLQEKYQLEDEMDAAYDAFIAPFLEEFIEQQFANAEIAYQKRFDIEEWLKTLSDREIKEYLCWGNTISQIADALLKEGFVYSQRLNQLVCVI